MGREIERWGELERVIDGACEIERDRERVFVCV